ncbi:MAG: hypothetical protein WCA77_01320 [Thermoplasmata archaeon]
MSHRSVGLVTRDPGLYAELAQVLRERRVPTVSLLPGQRIPDHVVVVLTGEGESREINHPRLFEVGAGGERPALWAAVTAALHAPNASGELIVGIDPGPRPGYAIVTDGHCVAQGTLDTPEATGRLGQQLRLRFPGRAMRFRVGSGAPLDRDRILRALSALRRPIEIVDERGTTPRGRRRPSDAAAARAIAGVPGRPYKGRPIVTLTPGEVSNLQRLSREGSGGKFTLSRSDAGRVLRGEISLGDALDEAQDRYVPPARTPKTSPVARERS